MPSTLNVTVGDWSLQLVLTGPKADRVRVVHAGDPFVAEATWYLYPPGALHFDTLKGVVFVPEDVRAALVTELRAKLALLPV